MVARVMGKRVHTHKDTDERLLRRITIAVDSALRERLGKIQRAELSQPYPVKYEVAIAYLKRLVETAHNRVTDDS